MSFPFSKFIYLSDLCVLMSSIKYDGISVVCFCCGSQIFIKDQTLLWRHDYPD